MAAERIELVEKPIYVIGGGLVEIGKYQATGRVVTAYRDQQPTMLVDTIERLEEDYQGFSVEKYRPSLEKLREMTPKEIATTWPSTSPGFTSARTCTWGCSWSSALPWGSISPGRARSGAGSPPSSWGTPAPARRR